MMMLTDLLTNRKKDMTKPEQTLPSETAPLVFVYGTLKKGHANHCVLAGATFLERMSLTENFYMLNLGGFPAVVMADDFKVRPIGLPAPSAIHGELYRTSKQILASLDILEGHPRFYKRRILNLGKRKEQGWLYMLPTSEMVNEHNQLKSNAASAIIREGVWRPSDDELDWITSFNDV